jgi:hypothetical protein
MGLALYPSSVRSSDLLGVIPKFRIEYVRDRAYTHDPWPFLNLKLKPNVESAPLALWRQ